MAQAQLGGEWGRSTGESEPWSASVHPTHTAERKNQNTKARSSQKIEREPARITSVRDKMSHKCILLYTFAGERFTKC